MCLDTRTCAAGCTADGDCAASERCSSSGGCVAKTGCGADADCSTGQRCTASGTCAQSCQGPGSCGSTAECLGSGTCAPKCTAASDCAAGQKCSTVGACVPTDGCGAKEDCASGRLCDSLGRCVDDCRTTGCNMGATCASDGQCLPSNPDGGPTTCGGELFQAAKVNSNMLIAFDKSGSMNDPIVMGSGGPSKWSIATTAIKQITTQYDTQIQFGLTLFPEGTTTQQRCVPAPISVTVGDARGMQIATALDGAAPGGSTPIGAVLTAAGMVPELADATRANYVMLVTDGTETCNGNGVMSAATNLRAEGHQDLRGGLRRRGRRHQPL